MPLASVTKDAANLTLTVVGGYTVPQQRLWDAFADPRQLGRFWGPPAWPATFTRHDMKVGGCRRVLPDRAEGRKVERFEAHDGEDNAEDENMPASMKFTLDATPTGSRLTIVARFSSVDAMEQMIPGMEQGLRAAMPQLDAVLEERGAPAGRA